MLFTKRKTLKYDWEDKFTWMRKDKIFREKVCKIDLLKTFDNVN